MPIKHSLKTFADRQAERARSLEKMVNRAKQLATKKISGRPTSPRKKSAPDLHSMSKASTRPLRPWAKICAGKAPLKLYARSEEGKELHVQPWAQGIVSTLLKAANEGGVYLCLVWPIQFDSLVNLHALANIERNYARDLQGMRTLLYPGTYSSRATLQSALVERTHFSNLFRSLYTIEKKGTKIEAHTYSQSFMAMLEALHDICLNHPEVENPSLGEIIPVFMYETSQHAWASVVVSPLERSLKKVECLARRRYIREKLKAEWSAPEKAPGALFVLHHTARKESWKEALFAPPLCGKGKPEVLLLDATSSADQRSYNAVRRIPDFLRYARDNGYQDIGSVVITDDPKTFFVLRTRLNEFKLKPNIYIYAAEGDDGVLSAKVVPADWKPEQRPNVNFSVSIVDCDASKVALAFQKLAHEAGNRDSPAHQALMSACLYILRLSNMPAGYRDLTAEAAETGGEDFGSQRNAWTPVRLSLQAALQSGAINTKRDVVDKAIGKAEHLIDAWTDATPMALKLLAEVQKYAVNGQDGLSIVLPNKKYILLGHRFLQRKLCEQWTTVETRLEWHSLFSVGKTLSGERHGRHFVFVGVNRNVLRLLVTHPALPNETTVLIAYKQADSLLATLNSMKEVDAFMPYRGRIELLVRELERRIKEVANPIDVRKLGELTMTFRLEDNNQTRLEAEQNYYIFELDDGYRTYASGWIYRYEPDEDPPFRRVSASSIREGDFIFEMSDELRSKIESALQLSNDGLGSAVHPAHILLKFYHDDVKTRCDLFFKEKKRSVLARKIYAKMLEIDPRAVECRQGRIYYWLILQAEGDTRPHAPKDAKFFKLFCKALQLNDEDATKYWNFIRNARRLNQNLGRELSARYAEILFQPESAIVYRNVSESVINQLQQEALQCVHRVVRALPPKNKTTEQCDQLIGENTNVDGA